jgi:hypothetical protein
MTSSPSGDSDVPTADDTAQHAARETTLSRMVDNLTLLYNAAPVNSLFVVVTGQGNTPYQRYLNDHRHCRQQPESNQKWSVEDEEKWRNAGQDAVSTVCYMKIKGA